MREAGGASGRRRLYRDHVVRFGKPGGQPLPPHRFTPGDVISMTKGTQSPIEEEAEVAEAVSEGINQQP